MKNFWIITPCWKRPEITKIVFQEFRWLRKKTKGHLNLDIVVVGDDVNLEIARMHGFHTVSRDNKYLGRKFNDGYEYAFKKGADAVIPVGSDSWIHPDVFIKTSKVWEDNGSIYYSTKHAMVDECGKRLGLITSLPRNNEYNKCSLLFYPRGLMKSCGFRPCNETQKKSCDRSTIENIIKNNLKVNFVRNKDFNPIQYLAFKNKNIQLWNYDDYRAQFKEQINDPWKYMINFYPKELVKYARSYYRN